MPVDVLVDNLITNSAINKLQIKLNKCVFSYSIKIYVTC